MFPNPIKLTKNFRTVEPPAELFGKVINRIKKERRLVVIKRRAVIFAAITLGSAIAFISAFEAVQLRFAESGFIQFFSLLFSDFQIVSVYWQNFIMSLLETLPAMSLLILLATVLVFLESLKFLVRDVKTIISFQSN